MGCTERGVHRQENLPDGRFPKPLRLEASVLRFVWTFFEQGPKKYLLSLETPSPLAIFSCESASYNDLYEAQRPRFVLFKKLSKRKVRVTCSML